MRDVVGASISILCMLHCFLPLILVSVGASFGLHQVAEHLHHEWMHMVLLLPIVLLLGFSLPKSFKKHRSMAPTALAAVGLSLLIVALVLGSTIETPLTIIGSIFVISAHLLNRRTIKSVKAVIV